MALHETNGELRYCLTSQRVASKWQVFVDVCNFTDPFQMWRFGEYTFEYESLVTSRLENLSNKNNNKQQQQYYSDYMSFIHLIKQTKTKNFT